MREKETVISALRDIHEALASDKPVDSFITKWAEAEYISPEVKDVYGTVRSAYAGIVADAIKFLEMLQ